MNKKLFRILLTVSAIALIALMILTTKTARFADEGYVPKSYGTALSLLPPIVAISLALLTKEVYSSLFLGVLTGALLYANGNLELAYNTMLYHEAGGLVVNLTDISHAGILVFVTILGTIVVLMNRSGSAAAFGRWADKRIKTRVGAQLATILMGVLIFVDDGFNCMTVGSVMRPITDRHHISRAKLAYLIDATAAPVCIIAPISSWAAAVSYAVPSEMNINGFSMFLRTIPYNFYALVTLLMMVTITGKIPANAKVSNLVIPVVTLIVSCIIGMLYTGGIFEGAGVIEAFSNADSARGLVFGSLFTLIVTFYLYMGRNVMSFKDFMSSLPAGFRSMCAPMIILILAWNLSGMTGLLGASVFIHDLVNSSAASFTMFLPVIIFIVSVFLAFSTGTSWGTFTILIPIVCKVFSAPEVYELMVISIAACLAGAVCGDHCSPISDTTIMASAGAHSDHVNHVTTQLPYAMMAAFISGVGYLAAGIAAYHVNSPMAVIVMPFTLALVPLVLIIYRKTRSF